MDLQNIQEQLNTEFSKQVVRLVFWFDDKGEYEDEVCGGSLCEDVKTDSHENNTFTATAEVALSPTFYGWVFQFAGRMRIVAPQKVMGEFKKLLVDVGNEMK